MKNKYSHIIWDWNGTLFDDVDWCVKVMNTILERRNMKPLDGLTGYHKVFCFPIIDYYNNIGFDFETETFETIAAEYIELYHSNHSGQCILQKNAEQVLHTIQNRNISQVILSASQIDNLYSQVGEFPISQYFDAMLGISDIYAKSKVAIGQEYIQNEQVQKALLIGDTLHDYEVAKALDADCLLIAKGHQSEETLRTSKVPVLNDISEVLYYI